MEFDKGFMSDSMFGKTVSELTAERQKKNMDIISDILYGKGADPKTQLADAVGAPLGIMFAKWAKSKMGDGKDSVLESARGVDKQELDFRKEGEDMDWKDPVAIRARAKVYFNRGEAATARTLLNMASRAEEDVYQSAFMTNLSNEDLKQALSDSTVARDLSRVKLYSAEIAKREGNALKDNTNNPTPPPEVNPGGEGGVTSNLNGGVIYDELNESVETEEEKKLKAIQNKYSMKMLK